MMKECSLVACCQVTVWRDERGGEGRGRVVRVQTKTEFETMKFPEENNDEEEIPT